MTRRELLKMALLGVQPFITFPVEEVAAYVAGKRYSGELSFHNRHTGETLTTRYIGKNGLFDADGYAKLNRFFRCIHTNETIPINPNLFLLLDTLRCRLGARERPFLLYSGYRCPSFNRQLMREDSGVARNSYHMRGMAADVCMDGVSLKDMKRTAKTLKGGGVGAYRDFVHVDVGPVRSW
ncbi:MAG TPA: DUF882 domain-containing protein [Syntrophobacteraceae bacterium]|nr:DUF882 domain-containing protein [Syntrophobacteraceae bacterium]